MQSRKVPAADARKLVSVRAQVTTEAPAKVAKVSKKDDEGVVTNKFKPKDPYTGTCLLNTKITGDDAPGETWHMVFSTEGNPVSAYVRAYTSGFYCVHCVHRPQEKSPTERDNPSVSSLTGSTRTGSRTSSGCTPSPAVLLETLVIPRP